MTLAADGRSPQLGKEASPLTSLPRHLLFPGWKPSGAPTLSSSHFTPEEELLFSAAERSKDIKEGLAIPIILADDI